MLVGYELSSTDDSPSNSESESEASSCKDPKSFLDKFKKLKKRRTKLSEVPKEISPSSKTVEGCEQSESSDSTQGGKKPKRKRNNCYNELNHFMGSTFKVCSEHDPYNLKKSKLETELDVAVERKDFVLAEKLSDELSTRAFATNVNDAAKARDFKEKLDEKEEKKKKRQKLKWAYAHKQRWETKGNM